jgi:UDP:flavonoid glycosyltransferase YjiC (YdhE family)
MMEGAYSATADYSKIKAPALAFFSIGYQKDIDSAETLPEPQRQNILELLKAQRKYHEQEIEHFRREIPSARVVVLTNADHDVFIDRKDDVIREMRAFLAPTGPQLLQISLPLPVDVEIPMPPTPVKADGKLCLVYELRMTNFDTNNLELTRVEVLRDGAKRPVATYTE